MLHRMFIGVRAKFFLGGWAVFARKIFGLRPKKTAMPTCKITLRDSPHPMMLSKNPVFRALHLAYSSSSSLLANSSVEHCRTDDSMPNVPLLPSSKPCGPRSSRNEFRFSFTKYTKKYCFSFLAAGFCPKNLAFARKIMYARLSGALPLPHNPPLRGSYAYADVAAAVELIIVYDSRCDDAPENITWLSNVLRVARIITHMLYNVTKNGIANSVRGTSDRVQNRTVTQEAYTQYALFIARNLLTHFDSTQLSVVSGCGPRRAWNTIVFFWKTFLGF